MLLCWHTIRIRCTSNFSLMLLLSWYWSYLWSWCCCIACLCTLLIWVIFLWDAVLVLLLIPIHLIYKLSSYLNPYCSPFLCLWRSLSLSLSVCFSFFSCPAFLKNSDTMQMIGLLLVTSLFTHVEAWRGCSLVNQISCSAVEWRRKRNTLWI